MARAIADGDRSRIRALAPETNLSAHGDDDVTLLEWAIWNKSTTALATLLEVGADPSLLGMDDETVAHMAATVDDPKYLKVLIEHQAPIDVVSPRADRTPLFNAVLSKRVEQIDLLVQTGADIHRFDSMGNSLLHEAASSSGSSPIVLKLLELGVDPALRNAQNATFQPAFFRTPGKLLNEQGQKNRDAVRAWLTAHGVPVEDAG